MRVIKSSGGWAIRADYYSPALAAHARAVPGMHNVGGNTFAGSLDAVELLAERLLATGLRLDASALQGARAVGDLAVPIAVKGLRAYQLEAVRFLLDRKRAILGDAMGLGKSCTALTAARALASKTLIVCPSYVRGVWGSPHGEIKKWWPDARRAMWLPAGTKASDRDGCWDEARICVIHYDILHAWVDILKEWAPRTLILDEAHALMSEGSRRSQAVKQLANACEFVWALTGTPLTNRPRDVWNVVDTVSPNRFGPFFGYGIRYCDAHKEAVTPTKTVWKFDGASNLEELHTRLSCFMLRRTVADVGLQLPPKTRQIINVSVPAKAQLMPNAGAKAMRESLDRAADAKIGDATALIGEHIAAGHRVVAFTWRKSVAEHLVNTAKEEGHAAELVHGGVSSLRRGLAIERAKAAKSGHVLAATIDSAGTGIDLTYADVCVFVELTYEPHKLLQAEARVHRFGQSKPVLIQYIIATGTTDELIANKVIGKLDTFEAAVGPTGESLRGDLAGKEEDVLAELYAAIEKGKKRRD